MKWTKTFNLAEGTNMGMVTIIAVIALAVVAYVIYSFLSPVDQLETPVGALEPGDERRSGVVVVEDGAEMPVSGMPPTGASYGPM